jgi:hypothetical protein
MLNGPRATNGIQPAAGLSDGTGALYKDTLSVPTMSQAILKDAQVYSTFTRIYKTASYLMFPALMTPALSFSSTKQ